MSKKVFYFALFAMLCTQLAVMGQGMAVNGSGAAANSSAMLDVSSTTQGMLVPRMDSAQRSIISSPATGLLVYQTNGVTPGFYFYNGTVWVSLSSGAPTGAAGGNLTGTYPNPTIASLPAISGANLTSLSAANLSGTVGTARLGTGTASANTVLHGNNTWSAVALGADVSGNLPVSNLNGGSSASASTVWKGDGSWGAPFTLTTTGTSGAATFSGGTLNIPTPATGGGGSDPVTEVVAYRNTATATVAPTTNATVSFNVTSTSPTHGTFDGTTFTATTAGIYAITANVGTTTLTVTAVGIMANGVLYRGGSSNALAVFSPSSGSSSTCIIPLPVGATVSVLVYNYSNSNTMSIATDATTRLTIVKL